MRIPRRSWRIWCLALVFVVACAIMFGQWSLHESERHTEAAEARIIRELGVTVEPLDDEIAATLGISPRTTGLVVTSLADAGPGDQAGLRPGDVIEQIGDLAVTDPQAAAEALGASRHRQVALFVDRRGEDFRVELIR